MTAIHRYLSLVRFSHTLFAMPFALIGFFLARESVEGEVSYWLILKVIGCMILARNAAMGFNRYADRAIDAQNVRTMVREIPSGAISARGALWFVLLNATGFVALTWFINPICFYLSPVALVVVLGYSYTKRFTSLCHFVLGLGLALAPIGAWLAVTGYFDLLPLLFSFTVLFWVSGFDMIYALQDEEFDKGKGLHSIPAALGKKGALRLSVWMHVISVISLLIAGVIASMDMWYWMGTAVFTGLLAYQHTLVKPDDLSKVNIAFFTTNGVASILFCVFVMLELYA
ncbi:MAG: UbiA family prenyltransferase [Bacteroidia bacterium]|nr:UbiA family prenyltransferase [Bacteroidia bacterium]